MSDHIGSPPVDEHQKKSTGRSPGATPARTAAPAVYFVRLPQKRSWRAVRVSIT